MSPYALPSLCFTHHTAGRVERLFFNCQVFPDSLLLSGGATLALGWGGFAALHYGAAPALMAREGEGADGLGRPARTALLYATGLCVVRPPLPLPLSVELWPLSRSVRNYVMRARSRDEQTSTAM